MPTAPLAEAAPTHLLVLVGLPGSGKSTVGRQLARRLGVAFIDSDQVIEQRIGCSIRAFFDREGEENFRDLEESVMDELTAAPEAAVLSTGGGAVLRPANRQCLHERGTVVYLRSSPEEVFRRIRHDKTRPLLQVANPLEQLRKLYAQRDPLYRETAHYVVETGRPSVATLVNMITMQLELSGRVVPEAPALQDASFMSETD
ncbi:MULTISPECIES: shikimate kinase [Giesbergeria]|uniref:Shikimate kinase n=1 Tax=Giesbergeria sinuosa TaxID=80883 RepID=A0ABV9QA89_9BURK